MNWLEEHLRTFVFPNLRNYVNNEHKGATFVYNRHMTGLPKPMEMDYPPVTGEIRPANGTQFRETGMLKQQLLSLGMWNSALGPVTRYKFLEYKISELSRYEPLQKLPNQKHFSDEQIVHTTIKNSVKGLKGRLKKGGKLILLGRDVWPWAVLAQKYGLNYRYHPAISRNVASSEEAMRKILTSESVDYQPQDLIFDTGFEGSILKAVEKAMGWDVYGLLMSHSPRDPKVQQFPKSGFARNRALLIEELPKYFQTGILDGQGWLHPKGTSEKAIQKLSTFDQFIEAALLTIWLWNFESPSWITGPVVRGVRFSTATQPQILNRE